MLVTSSEVRRSQRLAREFVRCTQDDAAEMAMATGGDCEAPDAMLNFAQHVSGYARYCPKMNA
jgi:hypothetical protein